MVMEVSAHASAMHRLSGMRFAVAAYTNLSQDHLDYFGDDRSATSPPKKTPVLEPDMTRNAVSLQCATKRRVAAGMRGRWTCPLLTPWHPRVEAASACAATSRSRRAGAFLHLLTLDRKRCTRERVASAAGRHDFNVYNALLAAGVCVSAPAWAPRPSASGLEDVRRGAGAHRVAGDGHALSRDSGLRPFSGQPGEHPQGRAPDHQRPHDRAVRLRRRPRRGQAPADGRDRRRAGGLLPFSPATIPATRIPSKSSAEIEEGIRLRRRDTIPSSRIAARPSAHALEMAAARDVVVLAGKGHETYQEIKGVKHPFDEKIVVAELLSELRG